MEPKSLIPLHPLTDTVAILAVLMVLPSWISVAVLTLYATLNSSRFVRSTLSLVYRHKLSGLDHNAEYSASSSLGRGSYLLGFLSIDVGLTLALLFVAPGLLDYMHLLAKAFVASNLASTKQKYIFNAFLSMLVVLLIENLATFLVKNVYLVYLDGSAVTDAFLYSAYVRYPKTSLKHLLYTWSPLKSRVRQMLIFRVDHLVDFVYATLSIYTIMCNINPWVRKLAARPQDSGVGGKLSSKPVTKPYASELTAETKNITVSPHIADSTIPGLVRPCSSSSEETADSHQSADSAPASFPPDHQILNMNDVSSASLVVAQNFENYCRLFLFPSLNYSNSATQSPQTASLAANSSKAKLTPYVEKRIKSMTGRVQQPIWAFVSAAKTMFGRPDLYSGEYYQQNALVTTNRDPDGWTRSLADSAQCFIWYTGETAVAFELRNVYIDQLLVMVNGIIWEQTALIGLEERELVIVSGLSPLSQYDVEFVNVNGKDERELLAVATVSTIHKHRILTESKHSSPLATLQESVVTTQAAIEREKMKLKKLKTDWRKRSAALKAEIESLNSRPTFTDETRNYKKVESLRQAVAKSEREISKLSKEAEYLYTQQSEVDERYLDTKRAYDSEMRLLQAFENAHFENLETEKARIAALEAERAPLVQKKEKLMQKKERIANDVKRLELEIEQLKTAEVRLRQEHRSIRAGQRAEKHRVIMNEISRFEKQLQH
ncbi:hypothetical protein KL927_004362 [Ogataea polymorpha]|nr:hypothetical protein KL927_004362 [Ogataea polymorpha]